MDLTNSCYRIVKLGEKYFVQERQESWFWKIVSWKTLVDGFSTQKAAEEWIENFDTETYDDME